MALHADVKNQDCFVVSDNVLLHADIVEGQDCFVVSGHLNFSTVVHIWNISLSLLVTKSFLRFDLSKVVSANSAGLALLLEWLRYAKERKKSISFENIPSQLLSIAVVAGIDKILF
jgi:phospholipid transport system transporter-binding protein